MTEEEKAAKEAEKAAKLAAKAEALRKKEEEKAAKLLEKRKLDILMSATTFFNQIYSYLSLELHSGVEKVHFQSISREKAKEKEIVVFFENKSFSFCRCYVKFNESFFNDGDVPNEFAKWITMADNSFSIPIDTINIIRGMKRKPGKGKSNVPIKFEYDADKLLLKYRESIDEDGNGSDVSIRLIKGTTDYWERLKQYVERGFIREEHKIGWIFDEDMCKLYINEDDKIVQEKTDKKLLEMAVKDLYIKLKTGDKLKPVYYSAFMTKPDERGCRWIMLVGTTDDRSLVVSQTMKVILK